MGIFNRKINHGYKVKEKGSIFAFFPYISRARSEAVVYFTKEIDITNASEFIKHKKKNGDNVSLFVLIVAAISKTFNHKPMLNRFILGRRIYQREIFDISYVMKKSMNQDAKEMLVTLKIDPEMSIPQIGEKMRKRQGELLSDEDTGLDDLMKAFANFPRIVLRFIFSVIRILDFYGIVPKFIRKELPFYCSVFISNLGSIGVDAPYHHLYELGTTSFFIAIGKPEYKSVVDQKTKTAQIRKVVKLNITVDERICDGFYLARALNEFLKLIENPENI